MNPDSKKHGMDNPEGMHAGDLPNVEADKDGNVKKTTITSKSVTLGPGKKTSPSSTGQAEPWLYMPSRTTARPIPPEIPATVSSAE